MRLIVLVAIAPLLAWSQYPNRPAAHAPAPFALGGPPPRTGSAARPPRAPTPIGGLPYGAERTGLPKGGPGSHSPGRHDHRGGAVGYLVGAPFYYSYGDYGSSIFDTPPPVDPGMSADADFTANLLSEQIQKLSAQVEQAAADCYSSGCRAAGSAGCAAGSSNHGNLARWPAPAGGKLRCDEPGLLGFQPTAGATYSGGEHRRGSIHEGH